MATTNVRKVKYLGTKKESTKAKKCKFKGCKNSLRKENKSGYCNAHLSQNPIRKRLVLERARKQRKEIIGVYINRELYNDFSDFCEKYGFNKRRKLEIILKEFLAKQDAESEESEC